MSHNTTFSPTSGSAITPRSQSSNNEVSWQSIFWPVIACTLTVMLQNTGRTPGAPIQLSSVLKSSVLFCAFESLFMLAGLVWMLSLGCSLRTAARLVWYARFEKTRYHCVKSYPKSSFEKHFNLKTTPRHVWYAHFGGTRCHCVQSYLNYSFEKHWNTRPLMSPNTLDAVDTPDFRGDFPIEILSDAPAPSQTPQILSTPINLRNGITATGNQEQRDIEASPTEGHVAGYHPGSAIDRFWRLSMGAFLLGALPQAIKVFGMRGIPFTQVTIGIFLTNFFISEIFRLTAGAAGEYNLDPIPAVEFAKEKLFRLQTDLLGILREISSAD
ncbi:hypothetical protein K458DRAFT_435443 [Lentithecium fluviatile CBS 122367]|uniref:Uncharacterized protein n=1 Tax=Lentithecium fluviatile CBS 122367 TaxID=1168545 RepID=A0A6G1ILX5_9PLEO|nr:hypothetical protein K458DRAFT_435443 [Lentithecium fluviatile CBS 122367]